MYHTFSVPPHTKKFAFLSMTDIHTYQQKTSFEAVTKVYELPRSARGARAQFMTTGLSLAVFRARSSLDRNYSLSIERYWR